MRIVNFYLISFIRINKLENFNRQISKKIDQRKGTIRHDQYFEIILTRGTHGEKLGNNGSSSFSFFKHPPDKRYKKYFSLNDWKTRGKRVGNVVSREQRSNKQDFYHMHHLRKIQPHTVHCHSSKTVSFSNRSYERSRRAVFFPPLGENPLVFERVVRGLKIYLPGEQKSTIRVQVNNRPISGIQVTLSIGFKAKMFFQSSQ